MQLFNVGEVRNFTGFRESRPMAGLQVIVPLKLGLKNVLIGLTQNTVSLVKPYLITLRL